MTAIDRSVMRRPQWHWWVIIPPVLLAALLFGAAIGEVSIPPLVVLKVLANKALNAGYAVDKIDEGIVWNYRMARAVVAMCCGAGLALSGVVLQALLRNALADPYLLGISAGASTGAVAVTILGLGGGAIRCLSVRSAGRWWLSLLWPCWRRRQGAVWACGPRA